LVLSDGLQERGIAWNFEAFFISSPRDPGIHSSDGTVLVNHSRNEQEDKGRAPQYTQEDLDCVAKTNKTRRFKNMKSKLVVSLMVLALLLCQGLAFAEAPKDNVTAVAEDVVVTEDPATGAVDETVVAEESVNGVVKEAVVADEVVTPAKEEAKM